MQPKMSYEEPEQKILALEEELAARKKTEISEQKHAEKCLQDKSNYLEIKLEKQNRELWERMKELNCLFNISRLIDRPEAGPETVFPQITEIIRSGWQYSDDTCVRIIYDRSEFRTANYKESPWQQTADIMLYDRKTGMVEVSYLKEYPAEKEGPFLKEERMLIDTIANRLGIHIQRKKAEKDLRESRERLELALEAANDGLWDWNLVSNEVCFSPRWYTMLGYEADEFPASFENWEKLLHPEDREHAVNSVNKHISGTEKNFETEFRLRCKNRKWRWIMSRGRVMERDAAGLPLRMLGTHRDISLRKEQEEMQRIAHNELEDRIAMRTIDLVKVNRSLLSEIRIRRQAEKKLAENEYFLSNILNTMQAGIMIIDAASHEIRDVNRYACRMIGLRKEDIIGRICFRFLCPAKECECPVTDMNMLIDNSERIVLSADGREIPVLKSVAQIRKDGRTYLIESFVDISELRALLREQEMDIHTARNILNLNNGKFPRVSELSASCRLFSSVIALPCHQEGGDHFFLFTQHPAGESGSTLFSLKDQSGHKVSCLLRSILTDMLHRSLLKKYPQSPMSEIIRMLNERIVRNSFFSAKDFFTALMGKISHENLMLEYMLCGHSHFLIIRQGKIIQLPGTGQQEGKNMPVGALEGVSFTSARFQLFPGDRILLFTDGLSDALLFGNSPPVLPEMQDVADIVQKIISENADTGLDGILSKILFHVSEQSGKRLDASGINLTADDITLLGLEIENAADYTEEIWQPSDLADLQNHINQFYQNHVREWKHRGYDNPDRLRLALSESAVNAWKHGNRSDPEKKIRIRYRYKDNFLLETEDEGEGFDPESIPNPAYGSNIYRSYGRGIMMIRCQTDFQEWNGKGNRITMVFDKKCGQ